MDANSRQSSLAERDFYQLFLQVDPKRSSTAYPKDENTQSISPQKRPSQTRERPLAGQDRFSPTKTCLSSSFSNKKFIADISKDFAPSKESPAQALASRYFVSLESSLAGNRRVPHKFHDGVPKILSEIQKLLEKKPCMHENMLKTMLNVTDELRFSEEIPFSMDMHIRCISNFAVSDTNNPTFSMFSDKHKDETRAKTEFLQSLEEINAKKLLRLKSIKRPDSNMILVAQAFLTLLCKVDKNIGVDAGFNIAKSSVWSVFLAYISSPGNVILTIRKLPELIQNKNISLRNVRQAHEIFKKVSYPTLEVVYDLLVACFRLHSSLNQKKKEVSGVLKLNNFRRVVTEKFMNSTAGTEFFC